MWLLPIIIQNILHPQVAVVGIDRIEWVAAVVKQVIEVIVFSSAFPAIGYIKIDPIRDILIAVHHVRIATTSQVV